MKRYLRVLPIWVAWLSLAVACSPPLQTTQTQAGSQSQSTRFAETYKKLQSICEAHPTFEASSIDFYDPESAQPWERDFYETAQTLFADGKASIDYFVDLARDAAPSDSRCIASILNTWPG